MRQSLLTLMESNLFTTLSWRNTFKILSPPVGLHKWELKPRRLNTKQLPRRRSEGTSPILRGGSRIFFRRGSTRLLLYFNTNKPLFFFCRIPVVLENRRSSQRGVRSPCTLPLDPSLILLGKEIEIEILKAEPVSQ